MRVAVFYQHYHTPDCATAARPYSVVQALARRHAVALITTTAWQARRLTHDFGWIPPGVETHQLDIPYANGMSVGRRLSAFLQYGVRAVGCGLRIAPPDVVFGSSTPLTVGLVAAIVARYWGVPWVLEVRDLWPDFPIQMGAVPFAPLERALYRLEAWLYRSAAHVITVSPDMTDHVRRRAPTAVASTLLPGTDRSLLSLPNAPSSATLRRRYSLKNRAVVLYAGTFGRANDIPTLVQTATRLREHQPRVTLVVAGHGHHAPTLRAAADRLPNVLLLPPQPHHRMISWFTLADLSLVTFIDRPVLATNAPGKFFDSLSAGTPVIVTNPGWTKTFVERHDCGWYIPPSRPDRLAERIATLFDHPDQLDAAGARGAQAAQRHFDRNDYVQGIASVLDAAVSHHS